MESPQLLPIGETAKTLGVSIDTLRRWEKSGKLSSVRSAGGHRYFRREDIEKFLNDISNIAKKWMISTSSTEVPQEYYCPDSSVFAARLSRFEKELSSRIGLQTIYPLVTSVAGEIGNNSFDHNIANWPDIRGIFFGYDLTKGYVVLADRGQGILRTLERVRPSLQNDEDALRVAFTEIITGRQREHRGNGLKYVRKIVTTYPLRLIFKTGSAELLLQSGDEELAIRREEPPYHGCFAQLFFQL